MAAYKDLVGQKITVVTSNPPEPKTGQMWYNSTDGKLKGLGLIEAISSASPLVYTNFSGGTFGTQTAAVIAGGYSPPTNPPSHGTPYNHSQEYNGNAWSIGGDLNTARTNQFGFGVETAGVVASGFLTTNLTATEEYNGTAFTSGNNVSTARRGMEGAGIQTAGMICGGYVGPAGTKSTEEYDGTNWTAGGDLTTSNPINYYNAITGTQTAGLRLAGQSTNVSEEYDGSSWTAGNTMNSPRAYGGSFGAQTAALIAGGSNPPTTYLTAVEKYDGTSFTVSPATLSSPRALTGQAAGGVSGNTAGIFGGGYSPTDSPTGDYGNTKAEEYNVSTNSITAAAWSSGGSLNAGRRDLGGFGTKTAAAAISGDSDPGYAGNVEEYNGSSWSEVTNIGTARKEMGSAGSQTAGVVYGGYNGSNQSATEEYDGTNWTSGGALSTARRTYAGLGIQTAALAYGGYVSGPGGTASNATEEYGGTSWTSGGNMNTGRYGHAGCGLQTAGLAFGGEISGPTYTNKSEEYNGTAWSEGNNMNNIITVPAGDGIQTDALVFTGYNTADLAITEGYDGTSWSTRPNLAQARRSGAGSHDGASGSGSSALAFGGAPVPSRGTATEEFTGETLTANVTNFATS